MSLNTLDAMKLRMHLADNEDVADEWIREVAALQQNLADANGRVGKLEMTLARFRCEKPDLGDLSFREQLRSQLIEQGLSDGEAKEAAEAKLAPAKSEAATEAVAAVLVAIDRLAESQRKELNGNPLTDGRYQGIKKCADVIRQALAQIEQPQAKLPSDTGQCPRCGSTAVGWDGLNGPIVCGRCRLPRVAMHAIAATPPYLGAKLRSNGWHDTHCCCGECAQIEQSTPTEQS